MLNNELNWSYVKLSMDQTKDLNLMLIQANYESNANQMNLVAWIENLVL